MAYKELEYMDLCTIIDLDNQIVDEDTGEVSYDVICENLPCDFQPNTTENYKGVLVQNNPTLYLPYDFEYSDKLSVNIEILVSRYRKGGAAEIVYPDDYKTMPKEKHLVKFQIEDWQEVNVRNKLVGIEIELREVTS